MRKVVRVLMVADILVEGKDVQDDNSAIGKALDRLDEFRESVLPSMNWGITLYRAIPEVMTTEVRMPPYLKVLKPGDPCS